MKVDRPKRPWMPMYWGDYVSDTGHLNAAGHGAYLMLIKHYWCTGKPLCDDDDELWRIACCDSKDEWLKLRPKIIRLFRQEDGQLFHKRVDQELSKALTTSEARSEAGRKGAAQRWQTDSPAMAKPMAKNGLSLSTSPSPVFKKQQRDVVGAAREFGGSSQTSVFAVVEKVASECGVSHERKLRWHQDWSEEVGGWLDAGANLIDHILPTIRRMKKTAKGKINSPRYFTAEIQRAARATKGD